MIVLLASIAWAAAPDVAVLVDQARLDLRAGYLDDAQASLLAAVAIQIFADGLKGLLPGLA